MAAKPEDIDEYLAALSADKRAALEQLRTTIRAAAPHAVECISYGLAAFRFDGRPLVAIGATANHCAFYLMSSSMVEDHQNELKKFDTSKGTIRFPANKPLPVPLVRMLVKARIAENAGRGGKAESASAKPRTKGAKRPLADAVEAVVATLKRLGTKRTRDGMARYAIPSEEAFGVSVGTIRQLARRIGQNHDLAAGLWETGWYEARMLAAFVDEPASVTPAQMDRWCRDFDNWAICDTLCFHLFDRTPYAWRKVEQWSGRKGEFVKRAAFALLASLTVHDKQADDEPFAQGLLLIEGAAGDERNFVKKAVNWALRSIGKRSHDLNAAAVAMSRRLAASREAAARWVGKDALRELISPAVTRRLAARRRSPVE
jgi:3-methyladenine DNA glycosylase AlkD/uncharacterized protein YdhG (YjbR/CyaY superfamily)